METDEQIIVRVVKELCSHCTETTVLDGFKLRCLRGPLHKGACFALLFPNGAHTWHGTGR